MASPRPSMFMASRGYEVGDLFPDDGRAVGIDAAPGSFPIAADDFTAASRANMGHGKDDFRAVALIGQGADDFGDDFAGFLDDDPVADADIFVADVVFVVKGSPLDRRSSQAHGLKVRSWRQDACTAEADRDSQDLGFGLFRREFIGNGPTRDLDRIAELRLLGKGIDFDDHAVCCVRQAVAAVVPAVDEGDDVFDVREFPVFPIDLEVELAKVLQEFFLAFDGDARIAA